MNLNLSTYCNTSSYSIVGLNILKELIKQNPKSNISLFPIGPVTNQEPSLIPYIQQGLENGKFFDYEAPSLHINHQWMLGNNRVGNLKCGMTFFETDKLTPWEIHHINYLDYLFVPTKWCSNIIRQYCNVRTHVVGLGVDLSIFYPVKLIKNKPITNFLYIGKASLNKGTDFAIKCFDKAFSKDDNVKLWLSFFNPFVDMKGWNNMVTQTKLKEKIRILDRTETQSDLAQFINQSTCLLSPSRAESWNLPLLESMACGKPAIITNIGGHEYAYTNSNYIIKYNEMETANDNMFFKPGNPINQGNWAKLDKDEEEQCIHYMRIVHQQNMDGKISVCQDNINKAKEFSWENCVKKLLSII